MTSIQYLNSNIALLRAISGMIPQEQIDINPNLNAHHTLIAVKVHGDWRIRLFQNTPAQFHGRPELVQSMTLELRHNK